MPTRIRRADLADLDPLVPLLVAYNAFERIPWDPVAGRPALAQLLATDDEGFILVADRGGELAGYALVAWCFDLEFAGRDAWLTDLFVASSRRRDGVGRALVEAAAATALAGGASALHLLVDPANGPANALYARTDFVPGHRLPMTRVLRTIG
jgi:GNAT superfamily N-acetyltransferase